jgi:pimeloyl-ACP methyl ester carboxylesterase
VESYPTDLEALRAALPHIQTPVHIIAGRRDAVVPLVNAEYLHERLPHSEIAWEDAAAEFAQLVTAWWAEGFKTCMKTSTAIAAGF